MEAVASDGTGTVALHGTADEGELTLSIDDNEVGIDPMIRIEFLPRSTRPRMSVEEWGWDSHHASCS